MFKHILVPKISIICCAKGSTSQTCSNKYVQLFTTACDSCQRTKTNNHPPKAPLLPMHEPEFPMQFIAMDIQHMPEDVSGYNFILLIGDLFSKFIEAVPLVDQSAPTIARALNENWILRHGSPLFLLSDQGSNVDGMVINELCRRYSIKKRRSSAYYSHGSGFAERNIRNIREVIRTVLNARRLPQSSWEELLRGIVFALNTSISKAINCIPFEVIHGRTAVLPIDVNMELTTKNVPRDLPTPEEFAEELKIALHKIYQQVNKQLDITRETMSKQYNKKIKVSEFSVGDKVWLKTKYFKTGESKKFCRNGPWTIKDLLQNGVDFRIIKDSTNLSFATTQT